jgi:hypothetical protein
VYHQQNGHETSLDGTERHIVRDGTLVITTVRESDAGTYLCNASNKEGSETLEVQLSVSSPLQVLVHPISQRVDLGKSAPFRCSISGFPRSSIHWLKDGQPLRTGARIRQLSDDRVHISAVSKEDRGMYQCFVKNQLEVAQGSAELRLGGEYFFNDSYWNLIGKLHSCCALNTVPIYFMWLLITFLFVPMCKGIFRKK